MTRRAMSYTGQLAAPLGAVVDALTALARRTNARVDRRGNEAEVEAIHGPFRFGGAVALRRLTAGSTEIAITGTVYGPTLLLAGINVNGVADRFVRHVERAAQDLGGPEQAPTR